MASRWPCCSCALQAQGRAMYLIRVSTRWHLPRFTAGLGLCQAKFLDMVSERVTG